MREGDKRGEMELQGRLKRVGEGKKGKVRKQKGTKQKENEREGITGKES